MSISEVTANTIISSYIGNATISTDGTGYQDGGSIFGGICKTGRSHGRYFGDKIEIKKNMESICKKCGEKFIIKTVGFSGCLYKISGVDIFGNTFFEDGKISNDKWKYFDISEAKCESVIIYVNIILKDIRFPGEQKFTIQTIWTARQFIEFYQKHIGNYSPLMLLINGKTVLLSERICDVIDNNKYYDIEFSCIPIGYNDDD